MKEASLGGAHLQAGIPETQGLTPVQVEPELRSKAWSQSSKQRQKQNITVKSELVYTGGKIKTGPSRICRDSTKGKGHPRAGAPSGRATGPQALSFHLGLI